MIGILATILLPFSAVWFGEDDKRAHNLPCPSWDRSAFSEGRSEYCLSQTLAGKSAKHSSIHHRFSCLGNNLTKIIPNSARS